MYEMKSAKYSNRKAISPKDGLHSHAQGTPPLEKAKRGGGTYKKFLAKSCCVCKYLRKKLTDKKGGFPQTTQMCMHCNAFVHARGTVNYELCWEYHLMHQVNGMEKSGTDIGMSDEDDAVTPG